MHSSNTSGRFDRALCAIVACGAIALAGCSSSSPNAGPACQVVLSGDFSESQDLSQGCATIAAAPTAPGNWALTLTATTSHVSQIYVYVDLGPSPSVGSSSSETVTDWAILAADDETIDSGASAKMYADGGSTACAYIAGSAAVPSGSFSLVLMSASTSASSAHGTLTAQIHVHAPPGANCGAADIENVQIAF